MHQGTQNKNREHEPVLLKQVLQYLAPQAGETFLDLTAGYGGHAEAVLARSGNWSGSVLVDRDAHAIKELARRFSGRDILIKHQDFLSASRELLSEDKRFDLVLADLGVSSPHLNQVSRGFSFRVDAPLDMRMDQTQELSAYEVVNTFSEDRLAEILRLYGEEPKARAIARNIVASRPVKTTGELAAIARRAWPGHSRIDPATRTFQAIRIAVNDELGQLEAALPLWLELLAPGGRIVLISFHSLEDRLAKQCLAERAGNRFDAELRLLTKHPVVADPQEVAHNPRARSAKLRAAVKIKTERS